MHGGPSDYHKTIEALLQHQEPARYIKACLIYTRWFGICVWVVCGALLQQCYLVVVGASESHPVDLQACRALANAKVSSIYTQDLVHTSATSRAKLLQLRLHVAPLNSGCKTDVRVQAPGCD